MSNWHNPLASPSQTYHVHAGAPQTSSIVSYANVIYYPNWKVYKGQPPSTLNLGFVSHVLYAFAWPNADGTISLSDEYADNDMEIDGVRGCMPALAKLKHIHPHLKVLLSVGGGGQGSAHFATVAKDDYTRHVFAKSAKDLVDLYSFDGIDVDWEHPANPAEGTAYLALLTALRGHFVSPKYTLTTALPAGAWALQNIPLEKSARQVDFINLMAYDFYGPWTQTTGHQAQLFAPPNSIEACGASGVQFVLQCGVPAKKILLGIPAYGRAFLGARGPGDAYTGEGGDGGTFEYRDLPRPHAHEGVDQYLVAAWCLGGDGGWVSYDNASSVKIKATWVRQTGLGGLFYWAGTGDTHGSRSLVEAGYNELHQQ